MASSSAATCWGLQWAVPSPRKHLPAPVTMVVVGEGHRARLCVGEVRRVRLQDGSSHPAKKSDSRADRRGPLETSHWGNRVDRRKRCIAADHTVCRSCVLATDGEAGPRGVLQRCAWWRSRWVSRTPARTHGHVNSAQGRSADLPGRRGTAWLPAARQRGPSLRSLLLLASRQPRP